jgi:hypothetical protein
VSEAPLASPYKGLANYTEDDAEFFFGRDREREVIIANLKARRLTLLYGESGVGKSSLLRAGVASRLLDAAEADVEDLGAPEFIPIVFSNWRDDALSGLGDEIRATVEEFTGTPLRLPDSRRLHEAIGAAAQAAGAYLLIILDQFEEYFLYHPSEAGEGTFAGEFPRAVNMPGLQAGFLVSIREDALAKLDRFKRDIPRLFDTYLRVRHLDAAAAREAILRPVERYNARVGPGRQVTVEPALVAAVLDQVRTGQVVLEQAGRGTLEPADAPGGGGDRIETPYLQLVMARLWADERSLGSRELRLATLAALGGAQEIVRTHLDAALGSLSPEQRYLAADLFHHLVTPSGTKIAHGAADLAEYVRRPEAEVAALLALLARPDTRIVRPVAPPPDDPGPPRFEIFHDVLAPSVLDWRTRQTAERRAADQRRAARAATRRRLFRVAGVLGAAAFAAMLALALLANSQRNAAETQRTAARKQAALAGRLADDAQAQKEKADQSASEADAERDKARRLSMKATSEARRATAASRRARAEEARARALAAENRRQAVKARALAATARHQAVLLGELATFNASVEWSMISYPDHTTFTKLNVTAPRSLITASCRPAGCPPFRHQIRGTTARTIPISSVVGKSLAPATRVEVLVTRPRVVAERRLYVIRRRRLPRVVSERCRPAGSGIPASVVRARCP